MNTLDYLLSIDINYIAFGLIAVFFTLEQILSTQFSFRDRGKHFWNSFLFQVLFFAGNLFWAGVTVFSIEWLNQQEIRLLFLFEFPLWVKLILGILLLDFTTYWFHRLSHRVPMICRFRGTRSFQNNFLSSIKIAA